MKQMNFEIQIAATPETVWNVLWQDASYREWTSAFAPGSHAVTDWEEGSKVLFLGSKDGGMVSRIAVKRTNEYMSFEHLGIVKDGVEDTTGDEAKGWAGSTENYTLTAENGGTRLNVDLQGDIPDEFVDYFEQAWPAALDTVKKLSENSGN